MPVQSQSRCSRLRMEVPIACNTSPQEASALGAAPAPASPSNANGRDVDQRRQGLNEDLASQGLPAAVVENYAERGIRRLYSWQAECLAEPGVAHGRNLVYCAPTSGGKTLVSEVLMLRRASSAESRKKAVLVLPYVSVVAEKSRYLQALCRRTGLSVKGFYGGSTKSIREPFDVAVCTIEKANALVNYLIEEGTLSEILGTFVVDELHLVGDESRGYLLEVAISKVLHLAEGAQVVGLSATLPNVEDIAKWLRAALYRTTYRPVPLQELALIDKQLLNVDGSVARELSTDGLCETAQAADTTGLVAATWEVLREGHNVLVFCSSKLKCEQVAEQLAQWLPHIPREDDFHHGRQAMLSEMELQPGGADAVLKKTLPRGIGFHHSGLSTDERAILERGYCAGDVVVLCATSTLAAGVNLPARRVVFQTPYMGNQFLDSTQYKQMAGRAGRAGQGVLGESVLIAQRKQRRQALELMAKALPSVASCLHSAARGFKRLLLEVLTVTDLGHGDDLIRFSKNTLLATQSAANDKVLTGDPLRDYPEIADAMRWLLKYDMVRLDERVQSYSATPLGRAVCASGLEPEQGVVLFRDLERARPGISLDTDLHICFLVTPPDSRLTVDWILFGRVLKHMSATERSVAERVGVRLDLIDQAQFHGTLPSNVLASPDGLRLQRFYCSLVLWAVLHETPPPLLLRRFALGRGHLQQLQQSAASFTTTVAVFCNRLQWYSMEALVLSFQQRLTFGVRLELVPLMQIVGMDCVVARALYERGLTTPVAVAGARPSEVLRMLRKTLPHNVPSAVLPEANAERLIEAAKACAKKVVNEKRKEARDARKRMQESLQAPQPKRQNRAEVSQTGQGAPRRDAASANVASPDARTVWQPQAGPQVVCTPHVPPTQAGNIPVATHPPQHVQAPPRLQPAVQGEHHTPPKAASWRPTPHTLQVPPPPAMPRLRPQLQPIGISSRPQSAMQTAAQARAPTLTSVHEEVQPQVTLAEVPSVQREHMNLQRTSQPAPKRDGGCVGDESNWMDASHQSSQMVPSIDGDTPTVCITPCRMAEVQGGTPQGSTPLSPAQLGEGLRRVGRRSLSPRDVEAIGASPAGSPQISCGDLQSRNPSSGSILARTESDMAAAAFRHAVRAHAAADLLATMTAAEGSDLFARGLTLPPLEVLSLNNDSAREKLETQLASQTFLGAAIVAGAEGRHALLLSLGVSGAWCIMLPPANHPSAGSEVQLACGTSSPSLGRIWQWFREDKNLCVSLASKEFCSTLLRYGVDARCAFAEPQIAHWLLDPDNKQQASVHELGASMGLRLAPTPGQPLLLGEASQLPAALRARIAGQWPECFLAAPLAALLLRRLDSHNLADSFWGVEMPIAVVLAWMEHFGIAIQSRDPCQTYSHMLYKMAALEERVREIVGRRVLLSSGEDVGRALFEDLELPVPRGVRFRRKNNGRLAYRSPNDLLKRLPSHPILAHIVEHRQLAHVAKRMEALARTDGHARREPLCEQCVLSSSSQPWALGIESTIRRVRTDFVQTATATGRLATAPGSLPLLALENPFEVHQVWRPSLHEELLAGFVPEARARVFTSVASEAPPRPRHLREGILQAVLATTCIDPMPDGSLPLAAYWIGHGWSVYKDERWTMAVRQVVVRHGTADLTYPSDQVWRLAAPIRISDTTPMLSVNPRRMLVADARCVLLSVDYSQLEVRLMAHFSQDERFVRILHGEGDVFRHVAAGWLRKPESEVTAEERSGAKRICYGLVYGVGAGRLALELGISRAQAQEFQLSFMREYYGVAAWVRSCQEQARQCGYVETLHGRRRFLPGLAAATSGDRRHAERQAVNTSCQASAADLVKTAMLKIHERLKRARVHGDGRCRMIGRMLLQIHDELLLEVDEHHIDEVRAMVVEEMVRAGHGLRVPLQVKWRIGRTWGDLE